MAESREIRCKGCGASLPYDEEAKVLKCKYCGLTTVFEDEEEKEVTQQPQPIVFTPAQFGTTRKSSGISPFWLLFLILLPVSIILIATAALWLPFVLSSTWDGSEPFVCDTNQKVSMSGKTADISGVSVIKVDGNCRFSCTNCTFTGNTAIEIRGNGKVKCDNCKLSGDVAVSIYNNGELEINSGAITGKETAVFIDNNGSFNATSIMIAGGIGIDASEGANPQIKLKDVAVNAASIAFDIGGNSKFDARNTNARGKDGIRAAGNSKVNYRGGSLEATGLAVEQKLNAKFKFTDNAKVIGRVKTYRKNSVEGL